MEKNYRSVINACFTYNIGFDLQRRFDIAPSTSRHDSSQDIQRKNIQENRDKREGDKNRAAMPAKPRTFGVYQSRSCRIREKRAELTVERMYVKSSTVIDSLPSSTLLWVDHEGETDGIEGVGCKGGGGGEGVGLLVFRPSALGTPAVPRRTLLRSLHPSPPGPL